MVSENSQVKMAVFEREHDCHEMEECGCQEPCRHFDNYGGKTDV